MKKLKFNPRLVLFTFLALALTFTFILFFQIFASANLSMKLAVGEYPRSGVLIVLGMGPTPSNPLTDRTELAAKLWQNAAFEVVIASGGRGGDEIESEAETISKELISFGVPKEKIVLESDSRSTYQNLSFVRQILVKRGNLSRQLVVVTHHFHAARVETMAKNLGLNLIVVSTNGPRLDKYYIRLLREVLALGKWYVLKR